jgi:hypothetical protein
VENNSQYSRRHPRDHHQQQQWDRQQWFMDERNSRKRKSQTVPKPKKQNAWEVENQSYEMRQARTQLKHASTESSRSGDLSTNVRGTRRRFAAVPSRYAAPGPDQPQLLSKPGNRIQSNAASVNALSSSGQYDDTRIIEPKPSEPSYEFQKLYENAVPELMTQDRKSLFLSLQLQRHLTEVFPRAKSVVILKFVRNVCHRYADLSSIVFVMGEILNLYSGKHLTNIGLIALVKNLFRDSPILIVEFSRLIERYGRKRYDKKSASHVPLSCPDYMSSSDMDATLAVLGQIQGVATCQQFFEKVKTAIGRQFKKFLDVLSSIKRTFSNHLEYEGIYYTQMALRMLPVQLHYEFGLHFPVQAALAVYPTVQRKILAGQFGKPVTDKRNQPNLIYTRYQYQKELQEKAHKHHKENNRKLKKSLATLQAELNHSVRVKIIDERLAKNGPAGLQQTGSSVGSGEGVQPNEDSPRSEAGATAMDVEQTNE